MNAVKIHMLLLLANGEEQNHRTLRRWLLVKTVCLEAAQRRFFQKVVKTETCWNWTGTKNRGYGQLNLGRRKTGIAHRWIYELVKGPIPPGLQIDHKCRNRSCVNPDHLEAVTPKENTDRGLSPLLVGLRGASKTHCKRGHAFTSQNTRLNKFGHRNCRQCDKIHRSKLSHKRRFEAQKERAE